MLGFEWIPSGKVSQCVGLMRACRRFTLQQAGAGGMQRASLAIWVNRNGPKTVRNINKPTVLPRSMCSMGGRRFTPAASICESAAVARLRAATKMAPVRVLRALAAGERPSSTCTRRDAIHPDSSTAAGGGTHTQGARDTGTQATHPPSRVYVVYPTLYIHTPARRLGSDFPRPCFRCAA